MIVSTYAKRGLIRDALQQSSSTGVTLKNFLLAALHGEACIVVGGRIRISFASGDISGGWTLPNLGLTQAHIFEVIAELLDRWDVAYGELLADCTPPDVPSDAEVVAQLMDDPRDTGCTVPLWAITSACPNFMYMSK